MLDQDKTLYLISLSGIRKKIMFCSILGVIWRISGIKLPEVEHDNLRQPPLFA